MSSARSSLALDQPAATSRAGAVFVVTALGTFMASLDLSIGGDFPLVGLQALSTAEINLYNEEF